MSCVQHHHHNDRSESTEGTEIWSVRSVSVRCGTDIHYDMYKQKSSRSKRKRQCHCVTECKYIHCGADQRPHETQVP